MRCKVLPGPPEVANIVMNEFAERFCYYGSRSLLAIYLTDRLGFTEPGAVALLSYWVACTYLTPLLGGFLSDAYWGRYHTILRFNVFYLAGVIILAASAYDGLGEVFPRAGMYAGLACIALGTGGIKTNIAPFGADQMTDPAELTSFFFVFYQSVNVGSLLAYVFVPMARSAGGYGAALTLPACMLVMSVVAFLAATPKYVRRPPSGSVLSVLFRVWRAAWNPKWIPPPSTAAAAGGSAGGAADAGPGPNDVESMPLIGSPPQPPSSPQIKPSDGSIGKSKSAFELISRALAASSSSGPLTGTWLDKARGRVPDQEIIDLAAVGRLLPIYLLLPFFWAIYESHSPIWTLQARRLNLCLEPGVCLQPENIQTLNPLLVVTLIPLFDRFIIPRMMALRYTWLHPTPLRRMSVGMFLVCVAWVCTALLESAITRSPPGSVSVAWQLIQYVVLTTAEICVSTTGLEFSYREAPSSMKGIVLALWYLTSAAGSYLNGVLYDSLDGRLDQTGLVWVSTGMMGAAAVLFTMVAARYRSTTPVDASTAVSGSGAGATAGQANSSRTSAAAAESEQARLRTALSDEGQHGRGHGHSADVVDDEGSAGSSDDDDNDGSKGREAVRAAAGVRPGQPSSHDKHDAGVEAVSRAAGSDHVRDWSESSSTAVPVPTKSPGKKAKGKAMEVSIV